MTTGCFYRQEEGSVEPGLKVAEQLKLSADLGSIGKHMLAEAHWRHPEVKSIRKIEINNCAFLCFSSIDTILSE